MSSGAVPKKPPKSKDNQVKKVKNPSSPVGSSSSAKGNTLLSNSNDGQEDKLVSQAVSEALRILEGKARREYGNMRSCSFRQVLGQEEVKRQVFVEPLLCKQKIYSVNAAQRPVKFENIFNSSKSSKIPPKLVLVIGDPGFGKSTLSARIVKEWALRMESFATKFKLVILYSLSTLRVGQNLQKILLNEFSHGIGTQFPNLPVEKILSSAREQLLIVLDGYDELPIERRSEVAALMNKDSFFHLSTILITSRPDALTERFTSYFERFITICLLNSERRDRLVDLYFTKHPEKAKAAKQFFKYHQLRSLANDCLEIMSVVLYLIEKEILCSGQRDSYIVFQIARILILRACQKESYEKHVEDEKLNTTVYYLGKLLLEKLKISENSLDEVDFEALGSLKEMVCKCKLFQVRSKNNPRWEITSKAYLICLSAYYMNEKLKKLKTVTDVHAFLRKHLGDPNKVKTIIFQKDMGYLILWGTPNEIAYLCRGTHSLFSGSFETILNLKDVFGSFVCKFKDPSLPKYSVYAERKSAITLTETFADMTDNSSIQLSFHFGNSGQGETRNLTVNTDRFSMVGYTRFSFAYDDTNWGKTVTKHETCTDQCLKANLLPIVILKEDFFKALKFKTWNLIVFDGTHCFMTEQINK